MSESVPPGDRDPVDQSEAADEIENEQERLPDDKRDSALARDNYRCRACNREDAKRGGTVTLDVHHREDDPDHCEYHALQNLTVLCPPCHRWFHRQPDSEDLPEAIQDRLDGADLEPTWVGILQYLAHEGPARTSTITEHVELETDNGVRQALYGLMAADKENPGVTGRLVAKDRLTDGYGLPWQIPDEHEARGVIPVSETERRGRLLDEFVRRIDEHLPEAIEDREEVLGQIVERDDQHVDVLRRRGEAFQFPFEEWAQPEQRAGTNKRQRVIEAVATLSDLSPGIPAELLVGVLKEPLATAGEDELAATLQEWVESDHPEQTRLDGRAVAEPTADGGRDDVTGSGSDHEETESTREDYPPEE